MRKWILLFWSVGLVAYTQAQADNRQYNIPFVHDGVTLKNALAGGLNSCQMSRIDVNMDGVEDLFFFDRQTARISIFVNMDATPGVIDYKYSLEYNHAFPTSLRNWVLLRDLNCDGKKDICANTGSGMRIFWNTSDSELSFSPTSTDAVQAEYNFGGGNVFDAGIFSIAPDIPAIADFEGDGDLDVWSWNDNAAGMYFYENRAADNGDCSVPDFECRGRWYGMFNEGPDSFAILYGEDFEDDFDIANPRSNMHTGGTILTVDLDQNGIKDIVAGDVADTYLASLLIMDSSTGRDSVFQVDADFPLPFGGSTPVEIVIFPAAYYEDVDNDGINDLAVCTNDDVNGSVDQKGVWFYKNNGLNDLPSFEWIKNDLFQDEMIDMGTSSAPVVFDVDQDGLSDILLCNRRFYEQNNLNTSVIWYYRNSGTATEPAFELIDDNWLDIPSYQWKSVYPAFYDMDGDSDFDMFLGDLEGEIKVFENTAGAGNPCVFAYTAPLNDASNTLIDIGQYAKPQFFDIDDDGKRELIIGEKNGNINCYINTGTINAPAWTYLTDSLGRAFANGQLGERYSSPYFFEDNEGQKKLILGSDAGQMKFFDNIVLDEDFVLISGSFNNIFEGFKSTPYMVDLNGNGIVDLLMGNMAGGLGIYYDQVISTTELNPSVSFVAYPNPADDLVNITISRNYVGQSWQLVDAIGNIVLKGSVNSELIQLDLRNLSNGIYLWSTQNGATARISVVHK
ncbi:MAG: hypothetical protein RLZZ262_2428 [Bacteroidota bacterium]|jgi:hypothetical protein